ncbi:DUF1641 domain-containing protein [Halobacillus sp. ACCC02827]|uniref:DUF1641 domain-containing protein n=1 Tax=Bacillaceae TaxID=186817 RepID=UPI0002A4D90F|nr:MULTISPECIES: DUF1641 domain-containing protein [Bacillaceae]ELK46067.1 hypothetical protein D479_12528 [Halobacillus sp. BAB-2008]QHT46287.1 DUF1641 domain-containing protein [Bacillus sp. SB49]WJE17109.1 DUF1641 domain-containing protein [Halobacillus sp. ACCC02827]
MAKAITNIKRMEISRDTQIEKDVQEVREAVADNKDAILKGIRLLRTLDEEGTLDTATAFLKAKDEALANVVKEIDKDQYEPLLNNIPELIFLLGDLNVSGLRDLSSRLNNGIEQMEGEGYKEKTSILDLAKVLKDPEINRSITMLLAFLKGMGK